jgi:hypothetical protein
MSQDESMEEDHSKNEENWQFLHIFLLHATEAHGICRRAKIPTIYAPTGTYIRLMCMVHGIFSLLLKLQVGSMEKV